MEEIRNRDSSNWESEPPDLRNWFSSYVYESPELDELESIIPDETKFRTIDICVKERGEKFGGIDEKEEMGFIKKQTFTSSGFGELSSCHENIRHDDPFMINNTTNYTGQGVEGNKNHTFVGNLPSEGIPEQRLGVKTIYRVEDSPSNDDSEGSSLIAEDDSVLLSMNIISSKVPGKSVDSTSQTKGFTEKENVVVPDAPSTDRIAENVKEITDLAGNGFISTRNNKRERVNDENSMSNQQQIEVGGLRSTNKDLSSKFVRVQRKALSEKTNLQYPIEFSTAGKWKCPQKNKPNPGPPLKQLRLEQWVRRL